MTLVVKGLFLLSVPTVMAVVDYQPTEIQSLSSHSLFNEQFNIDEPLFVKYIIFQEVLVKNHLPVSVFNRFIAIAKAESSLRQYDPKGSVLRGTENRNDIGALQINERVWGKMAKKEGLDIYELEDNIKMGLIIYKEKGFSPWNWSKSNQDKFLK